MGGRLEGKVAIVVGAGASAGGLSNGMAASIVMAREGARIFAVDRDPALAEGTRREIEAQGGECTLHACDVTDGAAVEAMAAAAVARYGRIDILFNNVGLYAVGGPLDTDEAGFNRIMQVNATGMFLTCRAVLPTMLAQKRGSIVNNASVTALRYGAPSIAYSASKAAVLQITQSIAIQYAAQGIRCNAILPGNIVTDRLVTRLKATFGDGYADKVREWGAQVPTGTAGEPWDVGNAVLFLASDEARYINAIELIIDGGLSASYVGKASA